MIAFLLHASVASAHTPVVWVVSPDEDWCGVMGQAAGGDEVQLAPGTYVGPCVVNLPSSEPVGEDTVLRSLDPLDPAVLTAPPGQPALRLRGARGQVRDLAFEDLGSGSVALWLDGLEHGAVRASHFARIAGTAVLAEDLDSASVVECTFEDVGEAIVLGSPDGVRPVGEVEVGTNLGQEVRVGVRIGPGASGVIFDDVWFGVQQVAVDLAGGGADDLIVERMFAEGAGVVVAGGPVVLRGSIVVTEGLALDASGVELDAVRVLGNTLHGAVLVDGWGPGRGLVLSGNATLQAVPTTGAVQQGNVACDGLPCFVDAAGYDFFPPPESPLREAGVSDADLGYDWCTRIRQDPPAAGALEGLGPDSPGPVLAEPHNLFTCGQPGTSGTTEPDPTDTATPSGETGLVDTGVVDGRPSESETPVKLLGCGCDEVASASAWEALVGALGRRSRSRSGPATVR